MKGLFEAFGETTGGGAACDLVRVHPPRGKQVDLHFLGAPSIGKLPFATVACCALAVFILIGNLLALLYQTIPIHSALSRCLRTVKEFGPQFKAKDMRPLNEALSVDPIVGEPWNEFFETLVYPDDSLHPEALVQNTRQSNELINSTSILERRVNVDWYAAVPGMLTAVGLTGTFVSIYFALGILNINLDDVTSLDGNLTKFINTLGGKFISSIFGIGFAFIFLLVEKSALGIGGIHQSCATLQSELNKRFKFANQETFLEKLIDKIAKTCDEVAALKRDLPSYIDDGLNRSIGEPVTNMSAQVQQLAIVVDEQSKKREESITRLVTSVVQSFKQALFDATNREFDLLATALTKTSGVVDGLNDKLSQSISQQESLLKTQSEQNATFLQGSKDTQIQLMEELRRQCESLMKAQSSQLEALLESVNAATTQVVRTNERISDTTMNKLGSQFDKFLTQVEQNSSKQLNLMQNSHEYMVRNLDTWIEGATSELKQLIAEVVAESRLIDQTIGKLTDNVSTLSTLSQDNALATGEVASTVNTLAEVIKLVNAASVTASRNHDDAGIQAMQLAERYDQHLQLLATQEKLLQRYALLLQTPTPRIPSALSRNSHQHNEVSEPFFLSPLANGETGSNLGTLTSSQLPDASGDIGSNLGALASGRLPDGPSGNQAVVQSWSENELHKTEREHSEKSE